MYHVFSVSGFAHVAKFWNWFERASALLGVHLVPVLAPSWLRFGPASAQKARWIRSTWFFTQLRQKIRSLATPVAPFLHPFDSVEAPCGSFLAPSWLRFGPASAQKNRWIRSTSMLTQFGPQFCSMVTPFGVKLHKITSAFWEAFGIR